VGLQLVIGISQSHSMAQRYEAGKEFKELLIANYDMSEREKAKPRQLSLFNITEQEEFDYEKILKECILQCKIRR
jgi:DNA adenine methylase